MCGFSLASPDSFHRLIPIRAAFPGELYDQLPRGRSFDCITGFVFTGVQ
jgi:hypothetical protein